MTNTNTKNTVHNITCNITTYDKSNNVCIYIYIYNSNIHI